MKVMMLQNIDTNLDVANGARGRITRIVLNSGETIDESRPHIQLTEMPAYIIVKLDRTKAPQLNGLEVNEIPIEPIQGKFQIYENPENKTKVTVTRTQLPITPAYAFTDYRSQGQTIPLVIVDIGKPPTGHITAFNAYVALSRSRGRSSIRLLRDFDRKLFTETPCQMLEAEDRRLLSLDQRCVFPS